MAASGAEGDERQLPAELLALKMRISPQNCNHFIGIIVISRSGFGI